jgi:ubiquinone/menaquinone biosynthesis C-methylase UbiE
VKRVKAINKDILDFSSNNKFDVVTALEVLEHIPLVKQALKNILRLAKEFVIITVPSKPDNNPEHVHFFSEKRIVDLINSIKTEECINKIQVSYVRNSMIVLIGLKNE